MNAREMNPFERHVEKIVLAVAAAGAIYLGYLAVQPVNILDSNGDPIKDTSGNPIAVERLEKDLADRLDRMEDTETKNKAFSRQPEIGTYVRNNSGQMEFKPYDVAYAGLIGNSGKPLPNEVVVAHVPQIGPNNLPLGPGSSGPEDNKDYKVVTPNPAPPEFLSVEGFQRTIMTGPPAVAGVLAPGTPGTPTKDQNAAVIQGYIPVAKMLIEMGQQKAAAKARLPDPLQKVVIDQIVVERRDKTLGSTTDWQPVPQPKSPADDVAWMTVASQDDLVARMTDVDGAFKQIVIPDAFRDENGNPIQPSNFINAKSPEVLARENALVEDLKKVAAPGVPNPPGAPLVITPPATEPAAEAPAPGADPAPPPASIPPPDLTAVKNQPLVPFVVWDDTILPDHTYEYRVMVKYVNPTFNWQYGVATAGMQLKETIDSPWVVVPGTVKVKADTVFFVTGAGYGGMGNHAAASGADIKVFKRTNGKWYQASYNLQPGMPLAGTVSLLEPGKTMDVDTGYVLVDAVTKDNETHVILMDSTGHMITREATDDKANPDYQTLVKSAEHMTPVRPTTVPTVIPPTPRNPPTGVAPPRPRGGTTPPGT